MIRSVQNTLKILQEGHKTSQALVNESFRSFEEDQRSPQALRSLVEFFESAFTLASESDQRRALGQARPLEGLPIAIKDNLLYAGHLSSSASRILENFKAPYTATVVERLVEAGAVVIGRCNQDEFAMGSSNEYSFYGPARNALDRDRVAGGSSGGSATAVASGLVSLSLGSDTGGSVRLPAAFNGVYGYKPSYGVLSRYGLVAYASSLDQVGLFATDPGDFDDVMPFLSGKDPHDMTSLDLNYQVHQMPTLRGKRVLFFKELGENHIQDPSVLEGLKVFKQWLGDSGIEWVEHSLPSLEGLLALYYTISTCQAASNLARFDGIRYGKRFEGSVSSFDELLKETRNHYIGDEVRRRIIMGNYSLSRQDHAKHYHEALAHVEDFRHELERLFEGFDFIVTPSSFSTAFLIGEKSGDPLSMYKTDLCLSFVNLAGLPAISMPCHLKGSLPVGIHVVAKFCQDAELIAFSRLWHQKCQGDQI